MGDKITVNDGGGLMDNIGLIDSLLIDCNDLPKALISGEYVRFCGKIVEMVQKLALLKQGVKNDTESMKNQIKELLKERDVNELECGQNNDGCDNAPG